MVSEPRVEQGPGLSEEELRVTYVAALAFEPDAAADGFLTPLPLACSNARLADHGFTAVRGRAA